MGRSHSANLFITPSPEITMLTQARLKELLHYDPETGSFTWKSGHASGWSRKSEREAGHAFMGYRRIKLDQKSYLAHRLAWLWVTGEMPTLRIDHQDLNKSNNKFKNLRLATGSQNVLNVGLKSNNTSGIKGVYWKKKLSKWFASININGKQTHLGYFADKEDAAKAVQKKRTEIHGEYANHG